MPKGNKSCFCAAVIDAAFISGLWLVRHSYACTLVTAHVRDGGIIKEAPQADQEVI